MKARAFRVLSQRDAELSSALGACRCWGDPRCPRCGGEGGPGWRDPDPDAFMTYVAPVLENLGLLEKEHPQDEPPSTGGSDDG